MKNFIKKYPFLSETARKLFALKPASHRLGKQFWHWYGFFLESENWTTDQQREYQLNRLIELVTTAQKHIPYYQQALTEDSIKQITDFESFQKLVPVIDRATFVNHFDKLCRKNSYDGKFTVSSSSGTTGTPLTFYHPREDDSREWAAICYQWKRVGYDPTVSKRAEFRGMVSNNRLVDNYPEKNMLRLNIFRINKGSVTQYAEIIKKNKIDFYHGFPSALTLLAEIIKQYNIDFPQPKAILLASEQVHSFQLQKLRSIFPKSKLFAHYGCAERTVLAGWCEQSEIYHILPQYGYVEIDPVSHEIIATNLFNSINPFIRYKMTDTIEKHSNQPCQQCNRPYTPLFEQIAGRIEDYLYSDENGWIPPAAVTYPLKQLNRIFEMQFVQKEKRTLIFKYKVSSDQNQSQLDNEINDVVTGLKKMLGQSMTVITEQVDGFERTHSGKFRWIINELDETPMKQE